MRTTDKQFGGAVRIGITCFIAYMSCYFGKNLLSAMMPQLSQSGAFDEISLGNMASLFLITYGAGQLINGLIGNRVPGRYMISLGLLFPGILLFLFPNCASPFWGTVLWGVCGFFCSMLWGPIARMIGENTRPAVGEILVTLMTVASTVGSLATQALAILGDKTQNYHLVFYISASLLCTVSISVFFYTLHMERQGMICASVRQKEIEDSKSSNPSPKGTRTSILSPVPVLMTVVTMCNGVIRNAVSFWLPSFLTQYFDYSIELSSALVMALPLFNIAGVFFTLWLFHKINCNEKTMCLSLFALSIPLISTLFFCRESFSIPAVISLFLVLAAMMGTSNLIFGVYLLRFSNSGKMSGISGFFDFASYVAASAASLFFTNLMATDSWIYLILSWCIISGVGAVLSGISLILEKKQN